MEVMRSKPSKMEIRLNHRYTIDALEFRGGTLSGEGRNGIYHWKGPDGRFGVRGTGEKDDGEDVFRVVYAEKPVFGEKYSVGDITDYGYSLVPWKENNFGFLSGQDKMSLYEDVDSKERLIVENLGNDEVIVKQRYPVHENMTALELEDWSNTFVSKGIDPTSWKARRSFR